MTVSELKKQFFDTLRSLYPKEEAGSFFNILAEEFLDMSRLEIALYPEKVLTPGQLQQFTDAQERLQQHEPVQYITGRTEFFGLQFGVNKNVLIPRPETEELVEWILHDLQEQKNKELEILDLGTGSGCIAISLAKNLPHAKFSAMDISPEALKVARENALKNEVQVDFLEQDILKTERLPKRYDVIVSNPPYVRELEKKEMQKNVLDFEPASALYVKDTDPLLFYEKITALAAGALKPSGALYFEINQYLGKETEALLRKKDFLSSLKKDIFGVNRMLKGIKHEN
ncbi:peptide chain release factor N(5)-glutamine methyltransferase [Salinimicrobium catena]|uniref:peptide chain release factor N(5)-glutamine methyltransferase n=1 Tax=Salinimicrobium catena TaxID=390640 RepID=UPI002FE45BE6